MVYFGGGCVSTVRQADLAKVVVSCQHLSTKFTPRLPVAPLTCGATLPALVPTVPVVSVVVAKTFVRPTNKGGATYGSAGCLWHSYHHLIALIKPPSTKIVKHNTSQFTKKRTFGDVSYFSSILDTIAIISDIVYNKPIQYATLITKPQKFVPFGVFLYDCQ